MTLAERETVTPYRRWRACTSKQIFFTEAEARLAVRSALQQHLELSYYRCTAGCGLYHLTSQKQAAA
jgi:hypothetical protein